MRKALVQVLVSIITFIVGFAAVWMLQELTMASLEVDPVTVDGATTSVAESKKHRFFSTYRACKPGYIQGYETDDGQQLAEGVASAADTDFGSGFRQRIQTARSPRVYVRQHRDHRGRVGDRYILENEPSDESQESVTILFYEGGDYYRFIDAPSLDLALEFEQFLIATDYLAF